MKLTFLGTGAVEGIPSPFCDCLTCEHARENGGHNNRRRQSVLINDHLLIDLGPDIFASCAGLGLSLRDLDCLLITHSHLDHFDSVNLMLRGRAFRLATELPELTMLAGPSVWTKWEDAGGNDQGAGILRRILHPGQTVRLKEYTITAIAACHHLRIGDAMNYLIDDGKASLLYASDSGYYEEDVWESLKGRRFDAVVLEGTIWNRPPGKEHLNRSDFGRMVERLKRIGAITDQTQLIATHFSHQSVGPHHELAEEVSQFGAQCAFDGLTVHILPES
ncbi:adenosylcobinamide kinase [Paenibacillus ihbetae]|uniref:Adenosylcobinamide kinase n=1 Tax=Paenibacillus ihbetae TaxID=1870820 RepID=A0A1B2DXR9_9BACL|nr:MBL fold metallo-hydrolase [Paenibacillus ihbetae]ANY72534.1 adenosylcobinamide kinase [Paenibacillus ihbetae]